MGLIKNIFDSSVSMYRPLVMGALVQRTDFFDYLLEKKQVSVDEVSRKTGINKESLNNILPVLKNEGLISQESDKLMFSKEFRDEIISNGMENVLLFYSLRFKQPVEKLAHDLVEEWLRNGTKLPYDDKGYDWEESLGKNVSTAEFTKAMDKRGEYLASQLKYIDVFKDRKHLLDVGGSSGIYSSMICSSNPSLKASVLDQPAVIEETKKNIEKRKDTRVNAIARDMFKPLPKEHDIHLYSNVMHDWNEETVMDLLKNSYNALPGNGVVAIHDRLLNNDKTGPRGVVDHSLMLSLYTNGRHYTEKEYSEMLRRTGFKEVSTSRTTMNYALITGKKR